MKRKKKAVKKSSRILNIEEFTKSVDEIIKVLPKKKVKEVKKKDVVEEGYEEIEQEEKKISGLEQEVNIPERPITGIQEEVPQIKYKKGENNASNVSYGEEHYDIAHKYQNLAEVGEADVNRISHFEGEGGGSFDVSRFASTEQRREAREKARKMFPWASEEDLDKYEARVLR
tara:strand:+ start:2419 stop:2937 length:519 start_codon:yes stop_codon:yes gene_type:complete